VTSAIVERDARSSVVITLRVRRRASGEA
jgi:hypothetical protein